MIPIASYGTTILRLGSGGRSVIYDGGLKVDADGSPRAYHPDGHSGLDLLANAGKPGGWYGIACDDHGEPFIQGPDDPAPGFYVSTTALQNFQYKVNDPRRYIDAEKIPYIVLPERMPHCPPLGAKALVINLRTGLSVPAIFADEGPPDELGEGSIALANALGIPANPRDGGCADGILVIAFQP